MRTAFKALLQSPPPPPPPPPPPASGCVVSASFLADPFILLKALPSNYTGECEVTDNGKGQKWEVSNKQPEIKVDFCIDVRGSEPIPYSVLLDMPQPQGQPPVPVKLTYSNFKGSAPPTTDFAVPAQCECA